MEDTITILVIDQKGNEIERYQIPETDRYVEVWGVRYDLNRYGLRGGDTFQVTVRRPTRWSLC